jgi:hypothetical protein
MFHYRRTKFCGVEARKVSKEVKIQLWAIYFTVGTTQTGNNTQIIPLFGNNSNTDPDTDLDSIRLLIQSDLDPDQEC